MTAMGAARIRAARRGRRRWLRIGAASASVLVLVLSGYGWCAFRSLSGGVGRSGALDDIVVGSRPDHPAGTNILVMGLDSRLDQDGNPLPQAVLDQLHAGDSANGGYNTNVLMVLHIPASSGHGAVGLSIPRDDFVDLPGHPDGVRKQKIKQGYGLAKDQAERELRAQGVTDRARLEQQGREAGRRAAIAAVEQLLGLRIDHFVEVTLVGFYDLARALGSVTVCLNGPTQDGYSGARFSGGYQRLDATQALAFVRQRRDYVHPELNFTDLDRARRQQAFLASVADQLTSAGAIADLGHLIDVARRDLVLDDRFDLLDMAQRLPGLLGGGISMTTLPVRAFRKLDGQDVNVVDPEQIRAAVRALVDPDDAPAAIPPTGSRPAAAPTNTVRVSGVPCVK
jgi:LCP family protein required for cell wall assembly